MGARYLIAQLELLIPFEHKCNLHIERIILEGRFTVNGMNPKILRGCDKLRDSSERRKRFVLGTELRTIESVGWLVRELSTP